jgi:hypothetical protein
MGSSPHFGRIVPGPQRSASRAESSTAVLELGLDPCERAIMPASASADLGYAPLAVGDLVDRYAAQGVGGRERARAARAGSGDGDYRRPDPVHRPRALSRLIVSAHRLGMQVVAWYLPDFANPPRDWRRVKAATTFGTAGEERFDGFALDIEATAVRDIAARNRRMLRLVSRIRAHVRGRHAVAAIIPDPVIQRYWPRFPYRAVRRHFDVILPMAYGQATCAARRPCAATPAGRCGSSARKCAIPSCRST